MLTRALNCLQVSFNNPVKYGKAKELFIAPEGLYSGQVCPPILQNLMDERKSQEIDERMRWLADNVWAVHVIECLATRV